MELISFAKEDYGIKMTLQESRKVQLDMLNELADFCVRNGLRLLFVRGNIVGSNPASRIHTLG